MKIVGMMTQGGLFDGSTYACPMPEDCAALQITSGDVGTICEIECRETEPAGTPNQKIILGATKIYRQQDS